MTARWALYNILYYYGCPENFRVAEYAHGYFSRNFLQAFVPNDPVRTKFEVCIALPFPEIIAIEVLCGVANPQFGEE